MNTRDIDLWKAFKILLVSPNGVGKSVAAASFHEAGPIHFADFDGRMKPIKLMYPEADIDYKSYGVDDFRLFLTWLEDLQRTPPKFKTLVIDSLTSLSMTCVMFQLGISGKIKTGPSGLPSTSWTEINNETVIISKVLEIMKIMNENHNTNVIMSAHPIVKTEIGTKDGENKKIESLVAYGNKVGSIAPGYFDEIYRLAVRKTTMDGPLKRVAITSLTSVNDDILAKSALGLPSEIDISKGLYQAIMSYKK